LVTSGEFVGQEVCMVVIVGAGGFVTSSVDLGRTWIQRRAMFDTRLGLLSISFVDHRYGWTAGERGTCVCGL
jgi:photosystem II stability/assembly factor-like uncharacterized protein